MRNNADILYKVIRMKGYTSLRDFEQKNHIPDKILWEYRQHHRLTESTCKMFSEILGEDLSCLAKGYKF